MGSFRATDGLMTRTSTPLVVALRSRARALGLTHAALASELGVSLSTIKRWLSGQGLDLAALERLLAALDLEWADLATLLPAQAAPRFQYTVEQESFFARHPGHLAFLDALLAGETPRAIARRHRLSRRSLHRY